MASEAAPKVARPALREAIRAAMRENEIPSVIELAKRANVARNTIYNWEDGSTAPSVYELGLVAEVLSVRPSYLVDAWWGVPSIPDARPDFEWVNAAGERIVAEAKAVYATEPEWATRLSDRLRSVEVELAALRAERTAEELDRTAEEAQQALDARQASDDPPRAAGQSG